MSSTQELFSLFYAVSFGAMLASTRGLRPFPWGADKPQSWIQSYWRIFFSLFWLNLVPFGIFAVGFIAFEAKQTHSIVTVSTKEVFIAALCSLSAFAPYRIYHFLMILLQEKQIAPLYDEIEYKQIVAERKLGKCLKGHALAILVYLLPLSFLLLSNPTRGSAMQDILSDVKWDSITAVGTLILAVVAIFGGSIGRWIRRPKLNINLKPHPPDCQKIPIRNTTTGQDLAECYYFRIWVENKGRTSAKNVEVFAKELKKKNESKFEKVSLFCPMNLTWSHFGEMLFPAIHPGMGKHCDVFHIVHPSKRSCIFVEHDNRADLRDCSTNIEMYK